MHMHSAKRMKATSVDGWEDNCFQHNDSDDNLENSYSSSRAEDHAHNQVHQHALDLKIALQKTTLK